MEHILITFLRRNPWLSRTENNEVSLSESVSLTAMFSTWKGTAGGSPLHVLVKDVDVKW